MKTWSFLLVLSFTASALAADLIGTVQQKDGQPIPGAWVKIYTARMRTGDSPQCPSCWADCAKSALTDAGGHFQIKEASGNLVFRLLVFAKGYAPDFADKVDPQNGGVKISLRARDLSSFKPEQLIQGQVRGPDHEPVVGARVSTTYPQKGIDAMTLTDAEGRFTLACAKPVQSNSLCIEAEGYVTTRKARAVVKAHQPLPVEATLVRGVTLSGRAVKEGQPQAGVAVEAVQMDRSVERFLGVMRTITAQDGTFVIYNAPARQKMTVYGAMESFSGDEALPVRQIETGGNESTLKLGDLPVQKARKISGRLIRWDNKPFPEGSRISINREAAWNLKIVPVNADGTFAADGLPEGETLAIGTPGKVIKMNQPLETDESRSSVLVKQEGDVLGLEITFEMVDDKAQFVEAGRKIVKERYGEFFSAENLPPEKIESFVTLKRKSWDNAYKWDENGFASCKAAMEDGDRKFIADITPLLGEQAAKRYKVFEDEEFSRGTIKELLEKHPGDWLTPADRIALVRSLTVAIKKFRVAYASVDSTRDQTPDDMVKECEAEFKLIVDASAEVLSPEKLAIVKQVADAEKKRELESIRKSEAE